MARSKSDDWLEVITDASAIVEARRLTLASTNAQVRELMVEPKGIRYAQAIDRLQARASRSREESAGYPITVAIEGISGTSAKKAARKKRAGDLPRDKHDPKEPAEHTALSQACSRLAAIGLIAPLLPEEIQRMRATEKRDSDDPAWSLLVLSYAHIRTCFDTESNEVPPRHDHLIQEFAGNSRGIFAPEAVLQREGKRRGVPVMVQFVFLDRLYRFQVRDYSDYYDLERLAGAINKAIADAGHHERFLSIDTGGQIADFIFGDPRLISEAAQEFQWTLDYKFNRTIVPRVDHAEQDRTRHRTRPGPP
jgi:hypothetical protein